MAGETSEREHVTVDDLKRIFIRAQDPATRRWGNVDVGAASDAQFDTWARSRLTIQGWGAWSALERAEFCDMLYQQGALSMLTKEAMAEMEER